MATPAQPHPQPVSPPMPPPGYPVQEHPTHPLQSPHIPAFLQQRQMAQNVAPHQQQPVHYPGHDPRHYPAIPAPPRQTLQGSQPPSSQSQTNRPRRLINQPTARAHSASQGYSPPPFGPIHYPIHHPCYPPQPPVSPPPKANLFSRLGQQLGMSLRPQRLLWVGGGFLAITLFLSNGLGRWGNGLIAKSFHRDLCQEMVQPSVSLSRDQLTEMIAVPERSPKDQIRQQAPEPYCTLTDLEIRAGVTAQREAYPLAFDPRYLAGDAL